MDNNFDIYWKNVDESTYLYGARVYFDKNAHYHNPLVPAGTSIQTWYMTSNYERDRQIPTLPILMQNVEYRLTINMECTPINSAYIKLIFYAVDKSVIETHFIDNDSFVFTYPKNAYSYTLQLMSASCETIIFNKMNIKVNSGHNDEQLITGCFNTTESNIKIFIFEEPTMIRAYRLKQDVVSHLENVYIVRDYEDIEKTNEIMNTIDGEFCLVSYGPKGSEVVKNIAYDDDTIIDLNNQNNISPLNRVATQAHRLKALTQQKVCKEVSYVKNC